MTNGKMVESNNISNDRKTWDSAQSYLTRLFKEKLRTMLWY